MRVRGSLVLALFVLAACGKEPEKAPLASNPVAPPPRYDAATLARYSALSDSGYNLLTSGDFDGALATFHAQDALIPKGLFAHYNEACALSRQGKTEEALHALALCVDGGFDNPEQLKYDPDLEPLHADPRFAELEVKAGQNHARGEATYAGGMTPSAAPRSGDPRAAHPDSLKAWVQREHKTFGAHRSVWFGWQGTQAELTLEAERLGILAARTEWHEGLGIKGFDLALERVRAAAKVVSPYEPWSGVSDVVLKEVERCLPTATGETAAEAHLLAGQAAYLRRRLEDAKDVNWAADAAAARKQLQLVDAGSSFAGAAAAYLLQLDLVEAGDARTGLRDRVKEFVSARRGDEGAMRVAGIFFQQDVIQAAWPLGLDAVDLDGRPVSLADYKGKALLIDFWATWCGPCRAELPGLRAAYDEFHRQGFEIVSISLDYADRTTPDAYRAWISKNDMPWRHVYDQQDWKGPLVKAYLVTGIPNPLLVGRDGSLVAMGDACRGERLKASIQKALAAGV